MRVAGDLTGEGEKTAVRRVGLSDLLSGVDSADANVVVYGSMAREEMTSESDLDWTLLLDKPVDPADLGTTQRIASKIYQAKFAEPGKTNIFGSMTFSHALGPGSFFVPIRIGPWAKPLCTR